MSKKIEFTVVDDGISPVQEGNGVWVFKSPIPGNLDPGQEVRLSIMLRCSSPVMFFEPAEKERTLLSLSGGSWSVQDAGTDLFLALKNETNLRLSWNAGTVLAKGWVLCNEG
jgi:hypothetical protein